MSPPSGADGPMSLVTSMLPASVQSRLPPLRSLRRTVLMLSIGNVTAGAAGFFPRDAATAEKTSTGKAGTEDARVPAAAEPASLVSHSTSETRALVDLELGGDMPPSGRIESSGVNWKYGTQGIQLLGLAREEAAAAATASRRSGPDEPAVLASLARKAFVDGVSYLLRALPADLDDTELRTLHGSFPPSLWLFSSPAASSHFQEIDNRTAAALVPARRRSDQPGRVRHPQTAPQPRQRSILHSTVQTLVAHALVIVHLLLPYLLLVLRRTALDWYRGSVGAEAAEPRPEQPTQMRLLAPDRRLLVANGPMVAGRPLGESRVARAIGDWVAWTVEGVAGGLTEGVGDGLDMVGRREKRKWVVDEGWVGTEDEKGESFK